MGYVYLVFLCLLRTLSPLVLANVEYEIISHEIVQSEESIEVYDSELTNYYPGVLIDIPEIYEIGHIEVINATYNDEVSIAFTKCMLNYSSGILLEVYVLNSVSVINNYTIAASTILIPRGLNEYNAAETDVVVLSLRIPVSINTQEIIIQTFQCSWS
jgi:hypothetical protein